MNKEDLFQVTSNFCKVISLTTFILVYLAYKIRHYLLTIPSLKFEAVNFTTCRESKLLTDM